MLSLMCMRVTHHHPDRWDVRWRPEQPFKNNITDWKCYVLFHKDSSKGGCRLESAEALEIGLQGQQVFSCITRYFHIYCQAS